MTSRSVRTYLFFFRASEELNKPLFAHLETLNQEINKLEEEIANTRSNILRNDLKIKSLV